MDKIDAPALYINSISDALGRGVFSNQAFAAGDTIELAPVFIIEECYSEIPKQFQNRVFRWGLMTGTGKKLAVALGYGSLYNHSDTPNLTYTADHENNVLIFIARKAIQQHEQLTIHYNQENDGTLPENADWFQTEKITKIDIS